MLRCVGQVAGSLTLVGCLLAVAPAHGAVTQHYEPPQQPGDLPSWVVASDAASDVITVRCASDRRLEVVGVGPARFRCADFFFLVVDGGDGNDTIDLSAMTEGPGRGTVAPLVRGNAGVDRVVGSRFADSLDGDNEGAILPDGGADTVHGGAGNDELGAGAGRDVLYGEGGNDVLTPGGDGDRAYGGPGNDGFSELSDFRFLTHDTNDSFDGGPGNDHEFGGGGNDKLVGGSGTDFLDGGAGADRLLGGAGRDGLFGGGGNDLLIGGPAKDLLAGGPGRNRLIQ